MRDDKKITRRKLDFISHRQIFHVLIEQQHDDDDGDETSDKGGVRSQVFFSI